MRHWAEEVAKTHLLALGYRVLAENYQLRGAEVDLIADDRGVLVVVEVKQRRGSAYGTPAESITPKKIARLRQAALIYMAAHCGRDDLPLRFDAVLILGTEKRYQLEHLQGVF